MLAWQPLTMGIRTSNHPGVAAISSHRIQPQSESLTWKPHAPRM